MHVIVIGAGEVGWNTAANLADSHDVVVVDVDGDRVDSIQYEEDVLGIRGDGTDLAVLEEAGIEEADMLIASTDSDETNIVACGTAKTIDDPFTIARVKKPSLLRTWERSQGAFGVDHMVSVVLLTAERIVRIAELPGAEDVGSFAGGVVRMAEFHIEEDGPITGLTVREADRYESLTFAALFRNGEVVIPTGDTVIEEGDEVIAIGSPDSCRLFARELRPDAVPDQDTDVVVFGGGTVGEATARLFEERGYSPRLVEHDADRARELAESLPGTTVFQNDATDSEFLEREHVGDAGLVVATLDEDERNLLVSLLSKRQGSARTVAVVETTEYVDLFETVGVDVAVNPRKTTAEEITRFTHARRTENVTILEGDRAEVIEVEVDEESVLAGRTIAAAAGDLPEGVVVGAITRGPDRTFITPRGDTRVEVGDHVVAFVDADVLDDVVPKL